MKRTKFLKFLAPIVALGLLIGALVGVSASANDAAPAADTAPEIISMNVEYGSELYLYYAVDKATVAGTPALEILDGEGNVIETVTEYTEETIWGTTAVYVFKAPGTAPKDINIAQNVRAVSGDVKGEVKTACIEDYLYAKLYKEGFAAKTADDGKDYTRRNLYFQLLKYARAAQEVFNEGDYVPVGAPALMISDAEGLATGKFNFDGDVITLKSNNEGFSYWAVDFITPFGKIVDSKLLANGYEVIAAENSIIATPVYNADSMDGVEVWDSSVNHYNYIPANHTLSSGNPKEAEYVIGENTWGIKTLDDGNRVLHIHKNCNGSLNPGYNDANKTYNWGVSNTIGVTEKQEGANVAIFEAKVCYLNLTSSAEAEISIRGAQTGKEYVPVKYYLNASKAAGSQFTYKPQENGAALAQATLTGAKVGTWFTIRIEYRTTEDGIAHKLFINDALVYEGTNIYGTKLVAGTSPIPAPSEIVSVSFLVNNSVMGDVYMDDVSLKLIVE